MYSCSVALVYSCSVEQQCSSGVEQQCQQAAIRMLALLTSAALFHSPSSLLKQSRLKVKLWAAVTLAASHNGHFFGIQ